MSKYRNLEIIGAGMETLAGWRGGWGVNILEDGRHSSVLYICKYFVGPDKTKRKSEKFTLHQHQFWMKRRRRTYGT
jgi:hypothetical protein